ncbi:putative quinol monooxygenase [Nocardiopsis coralliicola]
MGSTEIVIAGPVFVAAEERERFVAAHLPLVAAARGFAGCRGLAVSADPLDARRVNLLEHWDSVEALEEWRAVAPVPEVDIPIEEDHVVRFAIAESGPPFP